MFVNTNIPAMNTQRQLFNNNIDLDRSLERLSSGLRINTGADDASGLAMAEKMKAQGVGLTSAIQNTQDGTSLFKIADGALDQVGRILSRLEELVVRANNRTLTDSDRTTLQNEIGQLIDQVNVISNNTEYNTLKLLDGGLDIKKSLTVNTSATSAGLPGSMKVLNTPGTVKSASNLVLSITARALPAVASASTTPITGTIGIQNTININGVDVQIASSDTVSTIISKINQANSKTNVIAIQLSNNQLGLVSGIIDGDAQNVARGINGTGSFNTPNGSAVGYSLVGTAATINIGGDTGIWSSLGFAPSGGASVPSTYTKVGSNATGIIDGIQLTGSGNVLTMNDAGSPMYGIKIGTSMFNEAYGGVVFTGAGSATNTAVFYVTSTNDTASLSTDDKKKVGLQLGANYNQSIAYSLQSVSAEVIGVGASSKLSSLKQVNVITLEDANLSLKVIQKAIVDVTNVRAALGATLNRLDYTEKTIRIQRENMASAESKIRDADMALEMTFYTRNQILAQTATAMLSQANQRPQNVLQLLR